LFCRYHLKLVLENKRKQLISKINELIKKTKKHFNYRLKIVGKSINYCRRSGNGGPIVDRCVLKGDTAAAAMQTIQLLAYNDS